VIGQWPALALLFGLIFGLNVIPAFAPPTWMVLAFVGFEFPETNPLVLALVAAVAATLGRLTLAKLSHWLLRQKLLSETHRTNIDVIKERLEKRTALTFSLFLFYAFSPLPSNFLFIAYGLTGLPLWRVVLPFFIGRTASYSFFILSGAAVGRRLHVDSIESIFYASTWFIASQVVLLGALYAFTRVDWKTLFDQRKLAWVPKSGTPPEGPNSCTIRRPASSQSRAVQRPH
jgi:membrane protein YqaA with SNARE-associated domain